jgi:hypothetical protein
MFILPEDKQRIKDIMNNIDVNREHLSRDILRQYKREFRNFMNKYKGINFKEVHIYK